MLARCRERRQIDDLLTRAPATDARVAEQAAHSSYAGETTRTNTTMTTTTSEPAESGLVICDKPAGWTLAPGRRPVCGGCWVPARSATLARSTRWPPGCWRRGETGPRLLGLLALDDKAYAATIRLGLSTVTDDAEGEVTATPGAAGVDAAALAGALAELTGDCAGAAAVSAIKIDGDAVVRPGGARRS